MIKQKQDLLPANETKHENNDAVTEQLMVNYMDACNVASQLSANEKLQFISIAKAYQLNPFKREIYCISYGQGERRKLNIITGYEVYLKRAERTGKLAGWKISCSGEGVNMRACIEIHRKDWSMPLIHEVLYKEYAQETSIWKSKPQTMIKKVAIAQGFRLAFPDELGGMPYDSSELPVGNELPIERAKETQAYVKPLKCIVDKKEEKEEKECALESSSIMNELGEALQACSTREQLKAIAITTKECKEKGEISEEEAKSLRVIFNFMQEKLMGE